MGLTIFRRGAGMCLTKLCEHYVELAMDVLKTQNKILLKSLKDFLTGVPNSSCIEEVLTTAFQQLAVMDIEACRWLLRNSCVLLPEVDLIEQAIQLAQTLLQAQGFVLGQDFSFEPSGRICLRSKVRAGLYTEHSIYDRLLLEEIVHIHE
jgi:hypothetical protein